MHCFGFGEYDANLIQDNKSRKLSGSILSMKQKSILDILEIVAKPPSLVPTPNGCIAHFRIKR